MAHKNWPFTSNMISTKGIHDNGLIKLIFQLFIKAHQFSDNNYSTVLLRGLGAIPFEAAFETDMSDMTSGT